MSPSRKNQLEASSVLGAYRFILASAVVVFHVGGAGWLTGRVAVFGFYLVSGFLIFRVLDRVYMTAPRGIAQFFVNRSLRLIPLMVVLSALTYVFFAMRTEPGFVIEPNEPQFVLIERVPGESIVSAVWHSVLMDPVVRFTEGLPLLAFQPRLVPQGWSIGIELAFYAVAPIVLLAVRRRPALIAAFIVPTVGLFLYACLTAQSFGFIQSSVYQNFFTVLFMFLIGGAVYLATRRWSWRADYRITITVLVLFVAYMALFIASPDLGLREASTPAFVLHVLAMIPLGVLVCFTRVPRRVVRLDAFFGNLSYGMYLNQFLVAACLLAVNELAEERFGIYRLLGRFNTSSLGWWALASSAALALVTYKLVELPIEGVRERVRGQAIFETDSRGPLVERSRAVPDGSLRLASAGWPVVGALTLLLIAGLAVGGGRQTPEGRTQALEPVHLVNVRWAPGVNTAQRSAAEARYQLTQPTFVDDDPRRRTWRYKLLDISRSNIEALLRDPAVEDTSGINRSDLTVE